MRRDLRFLIVGLGLIGGSFAKVFKANGFEVGAIDLNEESIDYAINKGHNEQSKRSHKKSHICNTQQYINEDIYQSHE